MKVRPATHADLDGIHRVHVDAIRQLCKLHYTPEEIDARVGGLGPRAHRIDVETVMFFVAVDDAEDILGFAVLDVDQSEVKAVYVHPTAARRGIGAALLREVEVAARRRGLTVLLLDASLNSVEFYLCAGYVDLENRRHVLRSGVSIRCVAMSKSLAPEAVVVRGQPEMPVYLVPYDESWPAAFETERAAIYEAVGERIIAVEHFGSTAIAGMMAKPIIDIMVVIADITVAPSLFDPLELLGYQYFPYDEHLTPERRWFCKPSRLHRTHHLHVVEANSPRYRDSLAFRDFLREHPSDADRYLSLKRELAVRFPRDREAYTGGKGEFIRGIVEKARARERTT